MRENGIVGKKHRRFRATTDSKKSLNIVPNLLARKFHQKSPNRVWVSDVTAVYTANGWLYVAVAIDLCRRAVVGWEVSCTNDTNLALAALDNAVREENPVRQAKLG